MYCQCTGWARPAQSHTSFAAKQQWQQLQRQGHMAPAQRPQLACRQLLRARARVHCHCTTCTARPLQAAVAYVTCRPAQLAVVVRVLALAALTSLELKGDTHAMTRACRVSEMPCTGILAEVRVCVCVWGGGLRFCYSATHVKRRGHSSAVDATCVGEGNC